MQRTCTERMNDVCVYYRFHHDAGDMNVVMTNWKSHHPAASASVNGHKHGRHSRSISASSYIVSHMEVGAYLGVAMGVECGSAP